MAVVPMLGSLGSITLIVTMGRHSTASYVAAGLCLVASLGFVAAQIGGRRRQHQQRIDAQRGDYLRYLASVRDRVRSAEDEQRDAALRRHPSPAALPGLAAEGSRLGERGPGDAEFLRVRYGIRSGAPGLELAVPDGVAAARPDPICLRALERLVAVHRDVPALPATLDLRTHRRLTVAGDPEATRATGRALIASASALHGARHLLVAVLTTPAGRAHWDWLKWLPHALSPRMTDALGPRRLVATSIAELEALLPSAEEPGRPHVLLVCDGAVAATTEHPSVTVVEHGVRPGRDDGAVVLDTADPQIDRLDLVVAEAYARRWAAQHAMSAVAGPRDLMSLLGVGDVRAMDPAIGWRPRIERDRLRVPIGVDDAGEPVLLDLKEAAQQGVGPHGLVVGATGSGKSELLRTLVLGLAATHPPDELNLVLIDFKGGATFAGTADLPHVSAVITNLADDLALVDRMQDALLGEMTRRQELLRAAGNLSSIAEHARARRADPTLAALPTLLIVVDEFSELIAAKPDLTDLFVAIGRLGRSLGVHLLLASQRLEESRLRGLESHLSYRIGLRTFSAHESRAVLGVPDAYDLPTTPGAGFLRTGPEAPVRFQAAFVSGPAPAPVVEQPDAAGILPYGVALCERRDDRTEVREPTPVTLLELAVERLAGSGSPAHRVWLPPLEEPPRLADLLGAHAELVVPVGVVDRPRAQRRDVLALDLRGAGGHAAVVGGPRSGKSTLLRTVICALALTVSPRTARIYAIDLGAGDLADLAGLPHVSGVGTRATPDVVRRIVAELRDLLEQREEGRDDVTSPRPHLFLAIDGWAGLRAEFEDLEAELQQLAQRGLAHRLHLLTSSVRWGDYRPALRDLFGTRLELRLGEVSDSAFDRRLAATVPAGRPGRGLTSDGLHFLAASPADPVRVIEQAQAQWPGVAVPRLRLLPERIGLDELHRTSGVGTNEPGRRLLLGVAERSLRPVTLDPDADPHLLVLGDARSGKSALLRAYAAEVIRTRPPAQAQLVVVDPRRSLLGDLPEEHVLHHLTSGARATPVLEELAAYLSRRLPGPDVTAAQLRARSWWHGAEVFVLVDDYDLVATAAGSPLAPLLSLLSQASDVGLHLVLARRTGGAGRALYEPVVQSLRDLATPGLLLDGDPAEGPLLGAARAARMPPGRARFVTRDGVEVVQTAWAEPADSSSDLSVVN